MNIKERFARHAPEDVIELGNQAEALLATDHWQLVEGALENEKGVVLILPSDKKSSDEILGELRGYQRVLEIFKCLVMDRDRLIAQRRAEARLQEGGESGVAHEPGEETGGAEEPQPVTT